MSDVERAANEVVATFMELRGTRAGDQLGTRFAYLYRRLYRLAQATGHIPERTIPVGAYERAIDEEPQPLTIKVPPAIRLPREEDP